MTTQPQALALADRLNSRYELRYQERAGIAALLRTQHAEIEASNRNLEQLTDELAQCRKKLAAYERLTHSQEAQIAEHRKLAVQRHQAVATLQSERDANALLTSEVERKDALLRQAMEALRCADPNARNNAMRAITKELAK